jgi:hypothetical protein
MSIGYAAGNFFLKVNFFHTRGASYLNYDKALRQSPAQCGINRGFRGHFVPLLALAILLTGLPLHTILKR